MIAVLFELQPMAGAEARYFELAAGLRERLQGIDGFVSVERYRSLAQPDHYLSLSYWRDEDALRQWRNQGQHRQAQQQGRDAIFAAYRLRVARVLRDYGLHDRDQAPADARAALR